MTLSDRRSLYGRGSHSAGRAHAFDRSFALAGVLSSLVIVWGGFSSPASAARSMNLALRASLDPSTAARYGEVAAAGDFLLLATYQPATSPENGLYVIDASRPDSLALAAFLPTTRATRDISLADTLALVALEPAGEPGDPAMLLLSIADPRTPRVIGSFGADSASMAHNAWLDPPYAYMANSRAGDLRIVDFSDPSAPFEVAKWKFDSPSYLHDVMVSDTVAFLSYWEDGVVLLSVADPSRPYELGRYSYPDARSHSIAISADRKTAYVTDEVLHPPYGGLHILDISDLSNIVEVGGWRCPGFDQSAHNLHVAGDRLYLSYYTCGVRILDITSPREPREIAYYDMDEPGSGTSGFWGVAPRAGTDLVYASHIDKGAVVLLEREFRSWRVEASGGADFTTIQSAIDAAGAGDTVRVGPGTYAERVSLPGGISLEGSGVASTVIDAEGLGRALTVTRGEDNRIARLSLTGGRALQGQGGGGLLLFESRAVIESVSVFGNSASGTGGGALIVGGACEMRGVRFLANRAGSGGAIAILPGESSAPTRLADCELLDNEASEQGGGVFSTTAREVFLARCRIARNRARDGGGVWGAGAYLDLVNCVVAWNRADRTGGALGAAGTYYRIENSVVADNAAPAGAALWGEGAVSLEAEIRDAVFARNAGATAIEVNGYAPVSFDHSDFFANGGALVAGAIEPPSSDSGNIFAEPRFVEPTWERLDYLPGLESPLIDAGRDDTLQLDLDSTRQDIGVGGGPLSGWVAPRLPSRLLAVGIDNYDVCVCWDGPREQFAAYYRGADPTVTIDSIHRFFPRFDGEVFDDGDYLRGVVDTSLTPSDTAAYYRMVSMDERGRSGSPSGLLRTVPINLPPRPGTELDFITGGNPSDSLNIIVFSNESATAASIVLDGNAHPLERWFSSTRYWSGKVPRPEDEFVAIALVTDIYGAVGADTTRGDFIMLGPGREGGAYGTLFLSAEFEEDHLLLVRRIEPPPLPSPFVAASEAFVIDDVWPRADLTGFGEIRILGPATALPDERVALLFPEHSSQDNVYLRARRELSDQSRSARVPFEILTRAEAVLLVARDAPASEPMRFALSEPIPNPSRSGSTVRFEITRWGGESILLEIYDVSGRLVRRVHDGPLPTGRYSIAWDGRDDRGELPASGHYIVRGRAGSIGSSRHMTLVR